MIRISGRDQDSDGVFPVRVSFGDRGEYDVKVTDPAGGGSEALMAWYFEEHLRYPFLDKDLEQAAVARIVAYGEMLFTQVVSGKAYADYRMLRDRGFDGCRIEVSGPAGLHRLHWETLRDPDLPVPLAGRLPVTRRVSSLESKFEPPDGRPALNVLVVTARPDGPLDAGYRIVSRSLLDVVRTARLPVTIDLVRPGTWAALVAHLRAATEQHRSGWYQIVHFDVHGAFESYTALESGRTANRLLFGPGRIAPFAGRRGFLFFETANTGKAHPVAAQDVADLLAEHRVPVAILNACQSAMQDGSEAGLAQQLAMAGVPITVGMAYSVTVSAVEQAMPVLYEKITQGAEFPVAVQAVRRSLLDQPARQAYFGQYLDLADWMLPVMFAQQPFRVRLRPMDDAEQAGFFDRSAAVGEEPTTEYGFVGRDLDIQAIEHRILSDQNILLVQGMAGAGKTTLLTHLAWWWQRTGLVAQVFRFSYEDRAWTAGQIVREIRSHLLTPAEHVRADTMPEAAQADQVARLLRATRHLLILDNIESITAAPAAIPHALDIGEQLNIKTLLGALRGGRTLALLGSREAETWLGARTAAINTFLLAGLDHQAISVLTERVLRRCGAAGYLADADERRALDDLVTLLGGYPLPLTVVLPVLADAKPSAVLAELQMGGEAADPASRVRRAVEYSHGKLDPGLQASLQLLAPFVAVAPRGPVLQNYQNLLAQDGAIRGLGPVDLAGALDQAMAVGLAVPHPQLNYLVQVQPVLPWFLRSRLRAQPAVQAATAQAHYEHYSQLADELWAMLASPGSPQQRAQGQAAVRAEYGNLTTALAHAQRTSQSVTTLITALGTYLYQLGQHDTARQLLDSAIAAHPEPGTKIQKLELSNLHDVAGRTALSQLRLDDASAHYETAAQLLQDAGEHVALSAIYHQLGRVAQQRRQFTEAEASFRKALDIFLQIGDQNGVADTYCSLGAVAHEERRFTEAEASYRTALDIYLQTGKQRGCGLVYRNLGQVQEERRHLGEAEASYRKALDIFLQFDDQRRAAEIYRDLGVVAQGRGDFAAEEASYRKALDIFLQIGDQHGAAGTYHQLGRVAKTQRRFTEAQASYRKALDIFLQFDDQHGAALAHLSLGILAQEQRHLGEAEASYRKALDIYLQTNDQHGAAGCYHQLGRVAHEQQRFTEAEASYRKALPAQQESDPVEACRTTFWLGIALARLGQDLQATKNLLYAAVTWHQQAGYWNSDHLAWLHRQSAVVSPDSLDALFRTEVPADLATDLAAAVSSAPDPADAQDTDSGSGSVT